MKSPAPLPAVDPRKGTVTKTARVKNGMSINQSSIQALKKALNAAMNLKCLALTASEVRPRTVTVSKEGRQGRQIPPRADAEQANQLGSCADVASHPAQTGESDPAAEPKP